MARAERSRSAGRGLAGLGLLGLGLAALLLLAAPARAKDEEKAAAKPDPNAPKLQYARTYAEAMEEAKARHCVIFATFHRDH